MGIERHVRIACSDFSRPGVSLEAWGLLAWIGRFQAERWPSAIVRVVDCLATGANLRRVRRLLGELWGAGLIEVRPPAALASHPSEGAIDAPHTSPADGAEWAMFAPSIAHEWLIDRPLIGDQSGKHLDLDARREQGRLRKMKHDSLKKDAKSTAKEEGANAYSNARYRNASNIVVKPLNLLDGNAQPQAFEAEHEAEHPIAANAPKHQTESLEGGKKGREGGASLYPLPVGAKVDSERYGGGDTQTAIARLLRCVTDAH